MKSFLFVIFVLACSAITVHCNDCTIVNSSSGNISNYLNANLEEVCWIIKVPKKHHIIIDVEPFQAEKDRNNGIEVIEIRSRIAHRIVKDYRNRKEKLMFGSDVKIIHYARNRHEDTYKWRSRFSLTYKIMKGNLPIQVGGDPLRWGISWLKGQSSDTMSWKQNTPRAVVALHLASAANFNGSVFEEELMANQVDLRTSAALLRPNSTIHDMSMLINSLLVTCYNPRRFHSIDVVQRLKTMVKWSEGVVNPVAYIALCNANETWPERAFDDLNKILNTTSDFHVNIDMKAMAIMALSCYQNYLEEREFTNTSNDTSNYEYTIKDLKKLQLEDGSFGNVYTTALIAQALISDGDQDWDVNATTEYLIKKLNSSVNFLSAYLALPVLNGKSLTDIINTNCSAYPRRHGDDITDEEDDDLGPKIQIKYSLYIGDNKNVIHSIFLKVSRGSTAYQIMELAETYNPKYKFERKKIAGKVNVFEIADLPNDPESGKYWMLYIGLNQKTENLRFTTQSPNEVVLLNGQHLVMWYRSQNYL